CGMASMGGGGQARDHTDRRQANAYYRNNGDDNRRGDAHHAGHSRYRARTAPPVFAALRTAAAWQQPAATRVYQRHLDHGVHLTMRTLSTKLQEEFKALLPPTLFFFVMLHLVAFIRVLMLKGTGIAASTPWQVTLSA